MKTLTAGKIPTFSIITPSFNQGEFIGETIKSVLSQEGDFNIEYFIMDGGSSDNSVDIIKEYDRQLAEGRWPVKCRGIRYKWVSEKDKGQVDAIEKGFALAGGEIGAWLNSDDTYCNSHVFQKVLKFFEEDNNLQMVTADGLFIDKKGREFGRHYVEQIDFTELLYLDYHILQPATFLAKSAYKEERLDRSFNYCFDAEYFIRLISKGYKYKKIREDLACFRLYPETKTLSGFGRRYSESLRIARLYGRKPMCYLISAFYKYLEIILNNKYPSSALVNETTRRLRTLAYKCVIGKVR